MELCELLHPSLIRNHKCSNTPDEPITTEIIVACGLRILAGGKQSDQKHIFGLSRATAHDAFDSYICTI